MKTNTIYFFWITFFLLSGAIEMNAQYNPYPHFPGGEKKLLEYIRENLVYPEDAQKQGIEGRVLLRFLVTQTGRLDSIHVQRSLHPSCDAEALRIASSIPDWTPGRLNGEPVGVYYTLPIRFDLSAYKKDHFDISELRDSTLAINDTLPIIDPVEIPARFPDGEKALWEYMRKNIRYPLRDICVQGRVILRFVITPSGDIENIEVKRSLHPDFDKIAVEMVESMPKWIPGMQNGKPVYSYYVLPVTFRLEY